MYPNPADNEVSLKVNNAYLNTDYILTNLLGQTLLKQKITNEDLTINIEEFASGIYFLNIQGIAPIKIIRE